MSISQYLVCYPGISRIWKRINGYIQKNHCLPNVLPTMDGNKLMAPSSVIAALERHMGGLLLVPSHCSLCQMCRCQLLPPPRHHCTWRSRGKSVTLSFVRPWCRRRVLTLKLSEVHHKKTTMASMTVTAVNGKYDNDSCNEKIDKAVVQ